MCCSYLCLQGLLQRTTSTRRDLLQGRHIANANTLLLRKLSFPLTCARTKAHWQGRKGTSSDFQSMLESSVTQREGKLHRSLIEYNTTELTWSGNLLWWISHYKSWQVHCTLIACHCNGRVNAWHDSWSVFFESLWLFTQNQQSEVFLLELEF